MNISREKKIRGFTLMELLVVVSIIVVLLALLVPSLADAKRVAKTVKCAANLHGIALAQFLYATEWNDAIAGSATTSASIMYTNALKGIQNPNFDSIVQPPVFQVFDWMSPLASYLNIPLAFPAANGHVQNCQYMFDTERNSKILICPENQFTATPYATGTIGPMPSYNMALMFLFNAGYPTDGVLNVVASSGVADVVLPSGYKPRIGLVGRPSQKVLVADGSRYSTYSDPPNYDMTEYSTEGETDADIGAFDSFSRSWDRSMAPTNGVPASAASIDPRFYAFRHGKSSKGGPAGTFKMNIAFFDGHVELMDDLQGADPAIWCPSGSTVQTSEPWVDVNKKYMHNNPLTVP